jgi:hypothetical protein
MVLGEKAMSSNINININTAKQKADKSKQRISELKQMLADSDYQVLPDYRYRANLTDAQYADIVAMRKDWYVELKTLEGSLGTGGTKHDN